MALTDSLISYWKIDEASGNATDSHGGFTATENGSITRVSGKINNCGEINATDRFEISDSANQSFGNESMSVQAWANLNLKSADAPVISKFGNLVGTNQEYELYYQVSGDRWAFRIGDGTTVTTVTTGSSPSTGTWYHLVGVYDAALDLVYCYVNGSGSSSAQSTGLLDGNATFRMGRRSDGSAQCDAYIDEVALWRRALTSSEVSQLYNSGSGLAYPLTVVGGGATALSGRAFDLGTIFGGSAIRC